MARLYWRIKNADGKWTWRAASVTGWMYGQGGYIVEPWPAGDEINFGEEE